jgi:serine/threonine protein kinase
MGVYYSVIGRNVAAFPGLTPQFIIEDYFGPGTLMAIVLEQFIRNLTDSGLLPADEVASFQVELSARDKPVDCELAVQELVTAGKLTPYQAECLRGGETSGLVFGDYVVVDKIGQGGMGVVLKAEHQRMNRTVAVKRLSSELMSAEGAVERFYQEAEAAARVIHPNIVTAFDATEHDGIHCLIMEYVVGQDLASIVNRQGPLPVYQAIDYILQAAHGLQYAHQMGVVHRDIKPGNLLVTLEPDEDPGSERTGGSGSSSSRAPYHQLLKILDFGLARIDRQVGREQQLTSNDQVMGTCDYMAPEQATDPHGADHRADIYSLGCTFYRLLTGDSPYSGATGMAVLMAHREAPIPSLTEKRPEVPAELDKVFQRMVAKQPDDRYQSMTDVIAALAAIHRPERAGAATVTYHAGFPGGSLSGVSSTTRPRADEILVALCPHIKGSCSLSKELGNPLIPPISLSVSKRSFRPVSILWA